MWLAQPDLVNESERLVAEKAFKQVSEAYAQLSGRELLGLLLASICVNITKLSTLLEVRALLFINAEALCAMLFQCTSILLSQSLLHIQ